MYKDSNKDKGIWKIVKIIFFAITIPLLIIAISIMYKANKYPDKVPDIFGIKPMIVLSGSMETEIFTGDLVFVKEIDTDTLKVNDVIAFRNEKNTVTTHRIIEKVQQNGKQYFKTKGDANSSEDADLVSMESVEGVYIGKIGGLGNTMMFIQKPIGLAMIILIILLIGFILLYITNKSNNDKMNEEDKKEFEEFKKYKKEKEKLTK